MRGEGRLGLMALLRVVEEAEGRTGVRSGGSSPSSERKLGSSEMEEEAEGGRGPGKRRSAMPRMRRRRSMISWAEGLREGSELQHSLMRATMMEGQLGDVCGLRE